MFFIYTEQKKTNKQKKKKKKKKKQQQNIPYIKLIISEKNIGESSIQ